MQWKPDPDHPVTKVCSKCGQEKGFMEFHLRRKVGRRRPDCKACVRERCRRHYWANAVRRRQEVRQYTVANREKVYERIKEWRRRHPERLREYSRRNWQKQRERNAAHRASRGLWLLGLLDVGHTCADCGGEPVELHHLDYSDPYNVVPLCHRCHMQRHFAEWRKTGGGPVKYPEEFREGEGRGGMTNVERRMSSSE